MIKVKLKEIAEQFDMLNNELKTVLSRKTGKIHIIQEEFFRKAEDDDLDMEELPDWQQEAVKEAKDILENDDDYVSFPDPFDINKYSIMEDYCYSVTNKKSKELLLTAIKGKGAFGRFEGTLIELGIREDWFKFKDKALTEMAIEWCKENNIEYI